MSQPNNMSNARAVGYYLNKDLVKVKELTKAVAKFDKNLFCRAKNTLATLVLDLETAILAANEYAESIKHVAVSGIARNQEDKFTIANIKFY